MRLCCERLTYQPRLSWCAVLPCCCVLVHVLSQAAEPEIACGIAGLGRLSEGHACVMCSICYTKPFVQCGLVSCAASKHVAHRSDSTGQPQQLTARLRSVSAAGWASTAGLARLNRSCCRRPVEGPVRRVHSGLQPVDSDTSVMSLISSVICAVRKRVYTFHDVTVGVQRWSDVQGKAKSQHLSMAFT